MTIKLTFIKTLFLVLIIFMSSTPEVILAQTVTYDGGTPSRPIAVTGLVVNGISYDLTISYNIIYPFSTSESGFPQGDVLLAGTLLRDLLNTQGIDSDPTIIITAGKTTGGGLTPFSNIADNVVGSDDWLTQVSTNLPGLDGVVGGNNDFQGYVTATPTPQAPIPTMSQWGLLIFGLLVLNLSVFFVQRRELI